MPYQGAHPALVRPGIDGPSQSRGSNAAASKLEPRHHIWPTDLPPSSILQRATPLGCSRLSDLKQVWSSISNQKAGASILSFVYCRCNCLLRATCRRHEYRAQREHSSRTAALEDANLRPSRLTKSLGRCHFGVRRRLAREPGASARSARILSRSTLAVSSFGSCGTSSPRNAFVRMA